MNKKSIKTEKKIDTKEVKNAETKNSSTFKKKKENKKKYLIWNSLCLFNF